MTTDATINQSPMKENVLRIFPLEYSVRIHVGSLVIAEVEHGLMLLESNYPPVTYVPRDEVNMELLTRSKHTTHCPHKGQASYYSIATESGSLANAVWSYESPMAQADAIAGYLAFDRSKVEIVEVLRSKSQRIDKC